ncbi:hypothetical protein [Actinoplanes sp. NBRC 103695]|uniref:5-methylcytosine restriction system specificity protein McrC n=1 Tax=Actinoplanes sp. NBRC 103695 TaxID=3032202 RepID=UPI0024A2F0F0|nr:hypothetical protein [Actinoplanes sp. NBRC 103695]GLZ00699.1 hypothetical protein Acsp02_79510 [Actinoplanes sp. NBRC 103695]
MIDLVEYQTSTVELDHDEAAELSELARGTGTGDRPRVMERLSPAPGGSYRVQPGPYVGRFQLRSGRVVNVTGRFPFQDLAALLGLGARATMLYDSAASAGGGYGLMDLIGLAFAREAELIAGQGLIKAYERREFTRPPYPGRPAAALHVRAHAGRPDRLATTANRLTSDVPLNRQVAAALRRLCGLRYTDDRLTVRLRALLPVFQTIGDGTDPPPPVAGVPARYREIDRLARLVLDGRTTLPTGAGVAGVSVLFNMTKIWERHVGRWLAGGHPSDAVSGQHRIALTDSGPDRPVYADFVLLRRGLPVAVFDAKYRPWRGKPATGEIYQLYTYARRLGVKRAGLVYPGASARSVNVAIGEVTIESHVVPVVADGVSGGAGHPAGRGPTG